MDDHELQRLITRAEQERITRRRFLTLTAGGLGAAALAPLVVACGGPSGSTSASVAGLGSGEATITFWFFDPWVKSAVDAFQQKNTKIKVNFQQLSYADTHNKLLTSLAAGSGAPDVVGIELGFIGAFASKGGLVDLTKDPFNAGQFKNDVVAYKWAQGSSAQGALRGMPWDIGPAGLVYRADILDKLSIPSDPQKLEDRIKTWDDWLALGDEIRKKSPKTALIPDGFSDIFPPMVEQQGHGWFDGNKVVIEEKATKPLQRAVEAHQRKVDAGVDPGSAEWAAAIKKDLFVGGAGASWGEIGVKRDQPQTVGKWRAMHAPQGDFNIGGSFMAIPEQSQNKAAAWEFVKFVTASTEGALIGMRAGGAFPSYKPAWTDPFFDQPVPFYGGQKAYRLWLDIAQKVPGNPINAGDREASDIVNAEVALVKKQGKDPAQAMKDAEAQTLQRIQGSTP